MSMRTLQNLVTMYIKEIQMALKRCDKQCTRKDCDLYCVREESDHKSNPNLRHFDGRHYWE